jgi:hypothetical protein
MRVSHPSGAKWMIQKCRWTSKTELSWSSALEKLHMAPQKKNWGLKLTWKLHKTFQTSSKQILSAEIGIMKIFRTKFFLHSLLIIFMDGRKQERNDEKTISRLDDFLHVYRFMRPILIRETFFLPHDCKLHTFN